MASIRNFSNCPDYHINFIKASEDIRNTHRRVISRFNTCNIHVLLAPHETNLPAESAIVTPSVCQNLHYANVLTKGASSEAPNIMPIFQYDLGGIRETPPTRPTKQIRPQLSESLLTAENAEGEDTGTSIKRKASEESIRTELCEGPLLDSSPEDKKGSLDSDYQFPSHATPDKVELTERLKRDGNHGAWLLNRDVWPPGFFILRGIYQ